MKYNKKADSIAWIIIAVFILSFTIIWISSILDFWREISFKYKNESDLYILKSNSENILKKLDLSELTQSEIFYIHRDNIDWEYKVLTWSTNSHYRYINKDWNVVDPETYPWKVFVRYFQKNIDILRHDIRPNEINNLVFHFDANNIDWLNNSTISNWWSINIWKNLADNWVPDAVDKSTLPEPTSYLSSIPTLNSSWLNNLPMVEFNWIDQMLWMDLHEDINNDGDIYANRVYTEKSFAIVFKTWFDITNRQVIYEQWWAWSWYNFMIENWEIWAWIHNISDSSYANTDFSSTDSNYYFYWDWWHQYKWVKLGDIIPNTIYFVMIVQDSKYLNRTQRPIIEDIKDRLFIHENNRLKIYLNWELVDEVNYVSPMPEHSYWWLWNVYRWNISSATNSLIDDVNSSDTAYFEWWIWELISRNHALNDNEVNWVKNYFYQKWLWWKSTIRYDVVNTFIEEYNKFNNNN